MLERKASMLAVGDPVKDLSLFDANGAEVPLGRFREKYIHLVFIRHLACIACQGYLHKMKEYYPEFKAKGCEIVAVSMSKPGTLKLYGERVTWPFPLLADPQRKAYRYFDLKAGSIWSMLKPKSLLYYFSLMFRGWIVRTPYTGEDTMQLGGDFILDEHRRIVFAHRCTDPSDRPRTKLLFGVLR